MKKITLLLIIVFLCAASHVDAQVSSYTFASTVGSYTENSAGATAVPAIITDDAVSSVQDIGFSFVYNGLSYNQFRMDSNGFITFNVATTSSILTNNLAGSDPLIVAPLWDDLAGSASSSATYEVTGTAPNRILTVEWRNWKWNYTASNPSISFQVKLYETSNALEFVYRQEPFAASPSSGASIGINGGDGSYINLTDVVSPAISSVTAVNNLLTRPVTGRVFRFVPPPCPASVPFPWTEDFDGLAAVGATNFPSCWVKENGDWESANVIGTVSPRSGSNYVRTANSGNEEYLWTRGFNLTAGTAYAFSAFVQGDGNYNWSVSMLCHTSQSSVGATQIGGTYYIPGVGVLSPQPYENMRRVFVPEVSGVYYFALKVNQPYVEARYLAVDDLRLDITNAPVNDNCLSSTTLVAGGSFETNPVTVSNVDASASAVATPGCSYYQGADVWHKVTVPASGNITIQTGEVAGSPIYDTGLQVYSGDCGMLAPIGCNDDESDASWFSTVSLTGRTPGEMLYIRTWDYAGDESGTYRISAYDGTLASEDFVSNGFKAYPNPVKDILSVSYISDITAVEVFNMVGQSVIFKNLNVSEGQIDMSGLSAGSYIVKVTAEGATKTIKLIKS